MKKEYNMKIYFKHSYRCPISLRAKREMDRFLENNADNRDFDFELIDVVDNRNRSREVAEQFGISHESPQIIIADNNNRVLWEASHGSITEEAIKKVIDKNK